MLKLTALNPFRILSLPATTELKAIKKQLSAARKKLKVGLPLEVSLAGDYPAVEPAKALDEIEQALADPVRRTAFRCLWSFQKGQVTEREDFVAGASELEFGNFLKSWYEFEAQESAESLESTLRFGDALTRSRLADLLVREEGLSPDRARAHVEAATEMAFDELSCHVVSVARRNRDPGLVELLLDAPLLDVESGSWLEQVIKFGNQLAEDLAKIEATLESCETEELLEQMIEIVSPHSTRAELWTRALHEHQGAREMMLNVQQLEDDLGAIPGEESEQVVLREIVRLSTVRRFSDDPKVKEGWSEAIDLLIRVKPELLCKWLEILKHRVKGFSKENPELIELLEEHLKASEEGQRILTSEPCSRAVKFATAVCLEMAHGNGESISKAFDLAKDANRQTIQSELASLRGKYPNFFNTHQRFWAEIGAIAGTVAATAAATRWASETIVDATKEGAKSSGEDGCGTCIGRMLLAGFLIWLGTGGPCAGPPNKRSAQSPPRVESRAADSMVQKHKELVSELERQDQSLRLEKIGLESVWTYIETEKAALEVARSSAVSEQETAAFNERVEAYNSVLQDYATRETAFNEAVDKRNALLQEIRNLEAEAQGK